MSMKSTFAMSVCKRVISVIVMYAAFCGHSFAFVADNKRPDFSVACPSSEERAKDWLVPVLTPEQLVGPLSFLAVPYPSREPVTAKKIFLENMPQSKANLAETYSQHILQGKSYGRSQRIVYANKQGFPGAIITTTEYPSLSVGSLLWDFVKGIFYSAPDETIFRFVVDEGCGSLTVWQVGVLSKKDVIVDVNVRRVFDDVDFAKRGIPFVFEDFDQAIGCSRCVKNAVFSLVRFYMKPNDREIDVATALLQSAGATPERLSNKDALGFRIIPKYFPMANYWEDLFQPWYITVSFNVETGEIGSVSNVFYVFRLF